MQLLSPTKFVISKISTNRAKQKIFFFYKIALKEELYLKRARRGSFFLKSLRLLQKPLILTRPNQGSLKFICDSYSTLSSPCAKRDPQRACPLRALGLLLADGAPTVGRGRLFDRSVRFFTETAVTPERKVKKSFPRSEIDRHAEG